MFDDNLLQKTLENIQIYQMNKKLYNKEQEQIL